jgi:hypothetical protein
LQAIATRYRAISHIQKPQIIQAAAIIERDGIDYRYQHCQYWVTLKGREHPFIYLMLIQRFQQGTNKERIFIQTDYLEDYNRDRLTIETKVFVEDNISLYDDIVRYVWHNERRRFAPPVQSGLILDAAALRELMIYQEVQSRQTGNNLCLALRSVRQ